MKARIASLLTRDERPSRAFERVGAFTLADRLDEIRTGGDVLTVHLPLGPGQLRAHRIKLLGFDGTDTAVHAIREHGWRGFEAPTPEMFVRAVRAFSGLVYDVGANSGIYALLAAEARPDAQVVAFEPFPPALDALRANLSLNRSGNRVEVVAAAASDSTSTALLHIPKHIGCIETSASLNDQFKKDLESAVEVATTTLDDDWRRRGRPAVSVIKIDTETTEDQVLRGAAELVRSQRPITFYELLRNGNARSIREFANELDLINVRMTGDSATVDAPIEHDPRGWNQVLVPRERREEIVPLLEASNLVISLGLDDVAADEVGVEPGREGRWGSGPAAIEHVEILVGGTAPRSKATVATGDTLTLRMSVRADDRIERPVFGLAISTADGLLVTGPNTSEARIECDAIEGTGVVEHVIDRLMLLPGSYVVSVSLYDHDITHAYDFRQNVLRFEVEAGTPLESFGGVVSLDGRWTVGPFQAIGTTERSASDCS